jgi:hypothetical protein
MRIKTPSFIAEFPLVTTFADVRALSIRLDAARHIYNACLGETLRRLDLMLPDWATAKALPKGEPRSKERKARATAFKAILSRFDFCAASLQKHAERCRDACLTVAWRADDLWAVTDCGSVLASDGEWLYEPLPSNRTDEFKAKTRFDRDTAIAMARRARP